MALDKASFMQWAYLVASGQPMAQRWVFGKQWIDYDHGDNPKFESNMVYAVKQLGNIKNKK